MNHALWLALAVAVCVLPACAETGQTRVEIPLLVAGTDLSDPILAIGNVPLTVTRAELAFGPLYLCAGTTAGELCDTARMEWLDAAVIDVSSAQPREVGLLTGVSGPVRSWMFDLGISSQLTRPDPFVLDAAETLEGTSFIVEGSADIDGLTVPFRAAIPIQQTDDTELGVPVMRKSTSERFEHAVTGDEAGLLVRFDAAAWLSLLDLRPFVTTEPCAPGGPALACTGTTTEFCAEDGTIAETVACDPSHICLAEVGCAEQITIEPGTQAYRALRNAIVSGQRPSFEWRAN